MTDFINMMQALMQLLVSIGVVFTTFKTIQMQRQLHKVSETNQKQTEAIEVVRQATNGLTAQLVSKAETVGIEMGKSIGRDLAMGAAAESASELIRKAAIAAAELNSGKDQVSKAIADMVAAKATVVASQLETKAADVAHAVEEKAADVATDLESKGPKAKFLHP